MLILTNEDVIKVLSMRECMAALEEAFRDLYTGDAVAPARTPTLPWGPAATTFSNLWTAA